MPPATIFKMPSRPGRHDADSLVIYLVDHGGKDTFRMRGTETLSAADLDSWLDTLQNTMTGKVTVIYDACESGSFLSSLTPPPGKERTCNHQHISGWRVPILYPRALYHSPTISGLMYLTGKASKMHLILPHKPYR